MTSAAYNVNFGSQGRTAVVAEKVTTYVKLSQLQPPHSFLDDGGQVFNHQPPSEADTTAVDSEGTPMPKWASEGDAFDLRDSSDEDTDRSSVVWGDSSGVRRQCSDSEEKASRLALRRATDNTTLPNLVRSGARKAGLQPRSSKDRTSSLWERRRSLGSPLPDVLPTLSLEQEKSPKQSLDRDAELNSLYELKEVLGAGSMSTVHRAIVKASKEQVALKVLRSRQDLESLQRARQEFEILQRLPPHPHIIRALDFHELSGPGGVLVLEYFPGSTLQAIVKTAPERKLPPASVWRLGLALFQAIAHLHCHRVLHRDMKPENIMMTMVSTCFSDLRIGDFNVARHLEDGASLTPTGDQLYRAPEVLRGEPPSEGSDVWSAGLCVFFALTGALPWQHSLAHCDLQALDDLVASLDESVPLTCKASLSRALSVDPSNRPSAAELGIQDAWEEI